MYFYIILSFIANNFSYFTRTNHFNIFQALETTKKVSWYEHQINQIHYLKVKMDFSYLFYFYSLYCQSILFKIIPYNIRKEEEFESES